ncbi:MAG: flavodoxin family protein [Candidatus Lokiarchaeota archaeon]|nr:flavodoxin family protein [Candidatus Lokiarchaeota archaeon]MBD3198630.1 flavodoxin family protein [Candidatus Lokiarchaeota archaeon]
MKMKALILNGLNSSNGKDQEINDDTIEILKKSDFSIHSVFLKEKLIAPCQGCFDCWVKTPGICRIDDFGREVCKLIVSYDLVVHITPVTFGGYSYNLKKAIDRTIPNLLPFFKTINGEIHHKQRYKKRASLLVIGITEEINENEVKIFQELTYRNSLNMAPMAYQCLIYTRGGVFSDLDSEVHKLLKEVKK